MSNEALPPAYPQELVNHFESHYGQPILLRPILPADAPRLQSLHGRLSPESIYRRFFAHRPTLPEREAQKLATVDYQQSLALVTALADEPNTLIGVARFAPSHEREGAVEMAIVVGDAYQGHGIGRRLFQVLAQAAYQRGFRWMLVETQSDNQAMIELAERAGYRSESRSQPDSYQIWLDLSCPS